MRTKYKVIWLIFISCLLLAVCGTIVNLTISYFDIETTKKVIPIQAALPYVLTMTLMAIFTRRQTLKIESPIPSISRFNPPMILTGALMIVAAHIASQPIEQHIPTDFFNSIPSITSSFSINGAYAMGTFVIILPICQGWFFRGILQKNLARIMPRWGAIVLSASIYTLFHLSTNQCFTIMISHLVFAFIYNKYQSLSTVIGIHILFNGMTYFAFLLTGKRDPLTDFIATVSTETSILIWASSIILLIFCYGILSKRQA